MKTETTLKEDLIDKIIPMVTNMITKESEHLEWLKTHSESAIVNQMIHDSEQSIKHMNYRLEEYEDYVLHN